MLSFFLHGILGPRSDGGSEAIVRPDEVKTSKDRASAGSIVKPGRKRRWSRHIEGWPLGVVAVGIALLGVVFGVPRAAPPDRLPMPRVDINALAQDAQADRERVATLASTPLPFDIRSIGEAVRNYGDAVAKKDVDRAVGSLREARGLARRHRDEPALLTLRAVQTKLFLEALRRFESTGKPDQELTELGERFAHKAKESGWVRADGTLVPTEHERRVMFQIRWAELLDVRKDKAFAPSANQLRAYYGFLLAHPEKGTPSEARIAVVTAIERVDLAYPGLFARGVLFYRAGRFDLAERAFRGHLMKQPGSLRLRAQNHLAAAIARQKPDTWDE